MKFEILNSMPQTGSFVIIWEYNGRIHSSDYHWQDEELYELDVQHDSETYDQFIIAKYEPIQGQKFIRLDD